MVARSALQNGANAGVAEAVGWDMVGVTVGVIVSVAVAAGSSVAFGGAEPDGKLQAVVAPINSKLVNAMDLKILYIRDLFDGY
jgi:hypothetical protein